MGEPGFKMTPRGSIEPKLSSKRLQREKLGVSCQLSMKELLHINEQQKLLGFV